MCQEGASYEEVLKQAQELGYAERNPEADVEGGDACRKIAILTSIVYGKHLDYKKRFIQKVLQRLHLRTLNMQTHLAYR